MAVSPRDHDLETLLREFEASGLAELHVRTGEFDLYLSKNPLAQGPAGGVPSASPAPARSALAAGAVPAQAPSPVAEAPVASPAELPPGCVAIGAPYLGTFYRAPKPGEPNFVEIGDTIEAGTDMCLVEVMKLFTAVRSEIKGVVREIYAVDGQMVEEGQPLFALEPVS